MNTTSQTPAPTTFDSAALAEKLATTITTQITETFGADGLLRQSLVPAYVDTHLAHTLRSLSDEGLVPVLEELHGHLADFRARDERLLADSRYANALQVILELRLQQWVGLKEDRAEQVGFPVEVVLPAVWLARQNRQQPERTAAGHTDADWIAYDLNLLGDHDGPFELEFHVNWETDKTLPQEWLGATTE